MEPFYGVNKEKVGRLLLGFTRTSDAISVLMLAIICYHIWSAFTACLTRYMDQTKINFLLCYLCPARKKREWNQFDECGVAVGITQLISQWLHSFATVLVVISRDLKITFFPLFFEYH